MLPQHSLYYMKDRTIKINKFQIKELYIELCSSFHFIYIILGGNPSSFIFSILFASFYSVPFKGKKTGSLNP